jgi:hypothetical protein
VIAILAVSNYPLEKNLAPFEPLEENGLFAPTHDVADTYSARQVDL